MRLTSRAVRKIRRLRSLADAQDDAFNLWKDVQASGGDFAKPCSGSAGAAPKAAIDGGRGGYKVRCEIDAQVANAEQGEKPAKFFPKHRVARADFRLEPRVI